MPAAFTYARGIVCPLIYSLILSIGEFGVILRSGFIFEVLLLSSFFWKMKSYELGVSVRYSSLLEAPSIWRVLIVVVPLPTGLY